MPVVTQVIEEDVNVPTGMVRVDVSPTDYFLVCFIQTAAKQPTQWAYDEVYHYHTLPGEASHVTNCKSLISMFRTSGMFHVLRTMFDDAIEKAWKPLIGV
ncbi:MAG: hypothetical protein WAV93_11440 [Bacteroidales bacterium]